MVFLHLLDLSQGERDLEGIIMMKKIIEGG
jgi:hypothetical protein